MGLGRNGCVIENVRTDIFAFWRLGIWLASVHLWWGFHLALGCRGRHKRADAAPIEGRAGFLREGNLVRVGDILFRVTSFESVIIRDKDNVRFPLRNFALVVLSQQR